MRNIQNPEGFFFLTFDKSRISKGFLANENEIYLTLHGSEDTGFIKSD